MEISLVNYTGKGMHDRYAAELLIWTKSTRLQMTPKLFNEIQSWTDEKVAEELEYMSNTIPSSWEFIDYTFLIEDCNRGFTHQLVRNRHGSYAQQTMRVLDVSGFDYTTGPSINEENGLDGLYHSAMMVIDTTYRKLIEKGAEIEDARGLLPTNICTNIVVKFNLRTCAESIAKRSSPRVQGMYREFINELRHLILLVHPYFKVFLEDKRYYASVLLYDFIGDIKNISESEKIDLIKAVDLLRS